MVIMEVLGEKMMMGLKREDGSGQITIIQTMTQPQQQLQNIQQQPVQLDHDEKKMRRQIANSNERRRMQSINAGFQSLRQLLPHHEGEKLSKAAILQQTAEYIDRLEHDKQQLMATVQHLQRLVDSMGGSNNNNDCSSHQIIQQITSSPSTTTTTTTVSGTVNKKRKLDQAMAISDSSDEGLGSMSPEPVSQMIFTNGTSSNTIAKPHHLNATNVNVKDYVNLQNQMETERRHRIQLEEQLKLLEMQVYSSQQDNVSANRYPQEHQQEIVDEIDAGHNSEGEEKIILHSADVQEAQIHYISTANSNIVPHHSQYVVVSTSTPGASPKHITIVNEDDDNSRTLSSDELHKDDEVKFVLRKTKNCLQQQLRIPSILEQAIKAEPKVEVERINSPCIMPMIEESLSNNSATSERNINSSQSTASSVAIHTTYPNNNHQRPNLETIVEAIRHLEGDAFDMEEDGSSAMTAETMKCQQDAPLALITSRQQQQQQQINVLVKEPFKFRQSATSQSGLPQFVSVPLQQKQQQQQQQQQSQYQQQQQRPGVIVVKQSS